MAAEVAGRPVRELAAELLAISRDGLERIGHTGGEYGRDETGFLDPVAEIVERGTSPGEEILARFGSGGPDAMRALIDFARY